MKKNVLKNKIAFIGVILITSFILLLVFHRILSHPNQYLFASNGDAVKSYYNFAYYLRYDDGIHHHGVNYPYGDHLQYMNSHPLYLQIIKFIDKHIYPVSGYGVGILNLTMIISLLFAAPFIFLILRKFSLPPVFSVFSTIAILFLTPQIDRIGGHFEMVYAFFIPLYWYLLIRWKEGQKRWLWSILLIIVALTGGFTSAYYAAMLFIFPFALLLTDVWINSKRLKSYLPEGLLLLFVAVLPLLTVKGLVSLTDHISDRPDNPWGFFIFHSNVFSIFLPPRSMLLELTNNWSALKYQWEGRAYVGLVSTLIALSFLLTALYSILKRKKPEWKYYFPDRKLNIYLIASIIILIFSMGIPFNWGMEFLTDLLPPLKQFRCLGRFSWIFYYVFTVYAALFLYRFYRRLRLRGVGTAGLIIVLFALVYWNLEAGVNLKRSTKNIFNPNNLFESSDDEILTRFDEPGYSPEDFQAIFFLPFANTCGDKLYFPEGLNAFSQAMSCSYHTGLPIIESYSPRLSFLQAMSSIQLLADSAIYKTRVDDMNEKPVLLVLTNENLNEREKLLAKKAQVIWKGKHVSYAVLPVSAFNAGHKEWLEYMDSRKDSLQYYGNTGTDADINKIIYNGFEEHESINTFSGKGAKYMRDGCLGLVELTPDQFSGTVPVELSFWLYTDHRTDNMPGLELLVIDKENKVIHKENIDTRSSHDVCGMWVRISKVFIPEADNTYQFRLSGKYITVDDLLVKPAANDVMILEENKPVLFNNFKI